jgi:hypothetical protein
MSYKATVFKTMIASPSDVEAERAVIREMLSEWNTVHSDRRKVVLLAVGWETHSAPEMGDRPQAIINKRVLRDCDLLVGVFWTRIGTATEEYASGTVEEIEEHIKLGKPVMLYFSAVPVVPDSVDPEQYSALRKFKESCKSRGILETYSNLADFRSKFYRQLQIKLNQDYFTEGRETGPLVVDEPRQERTFNLSREARALLMGCADDPSGMIMRLRTLSGTSIQTSRKNFVTDHSPRSVAVWEAALDELLSEGLVTSDGRQGEVFRLTRKGYELADFLRAAPRE